MKLIFKNLLIFFLLILSFCLMSCKGIKKNGDRPKEEEINYFYMVRVYRFSMTPLDSHDNLSSLYDDYDTEDLEEAHQHLTEEDLKSYIDVIGFIENDDIYIINLHGDLVNIMSLVNQNDAVRIEYEGGSDVYFKTKKNLKNYREVDEYFHTRKGYYIEYYCKSPHHLKITTKDIEEYTILVRLYDENNIILTENKMKDAFLPKHNHIKNFIIGLLELPPKNQRKNLKYRFVRLKPNGEPSLYFDNEVKPLRNYMSEEKLVPYSEYKNWNYSKETGCYWYFYSPTR